MKTTLGAQRKSRHSDKKAEHAAHLLATRIAASAKKSGRGLRRVTTEELTIRRFKRSGGFSYRTHDGKPIRDKATLRRLASLAVPPAYQDVRYATDAAAHIQAIGRDDAGRIQYRYHPEWVKIREDRKGRHLARLIASLPRIRRAITQQLSIKEPSRAFALSAAIELVASTSIRAGSEGYAKDHGTRGAATLLKSNVTVKGDMVSLSFRAKGGKPFNKELRAKRLARALVRLKALPGRRLFQYRGDDGAVYAIRSQDINVFLREIAGASVSLKDFRTLCASSTVLGLLARETPAESQRGRKRQVREAVEAAAETLNNTPAICRKSYVHDGVVTAFENGELADFADALKGTRTSNRSEQFLTKVISAAAG